MKQRGNSGEDAAPPPRLLADPFTDLVTNLLYARASSESSTIRSEAISSSGSSSSLASR